MVDHAQFKALFLHAQHKRLYFLDPLVADCTKRLLNALVKYHLLFGNGSHWTYHTIHCPFQYDTFNCGTWVIEEKKSLRRQAWVMGGHG